MATIVFAMNVSLDGYVADLDGDVRAMPVPDAKLFRYWIEYMRGLAGSIYGRRMYEVMRYWEDDQPEWGEGEHEFATVWRAQPKWVVSRTLKSVGSRTTLVNADLDTFVRRLKSDINGIIAVSGPELAASLTELDLIDEYHLHVRAHVLGNGKPYFARVKPPLRLLGTSVVGEDTVRLAYVRS